MDTQTVSQRLKRQLLTPSGFAARVLLLIVVLIQALLSSACDSEDIPGLAQPKSTLPPPPAASYEGGPQAWIEYPLEGQTMPLEEPVPFVVYATDAKGVAQVELRVNGEPLPAVQSTAQSPDGSGRLVRLDQEWQPAAEGEYIVEARGRNAAGGYGEPAYVKFCVGSCQLPTPTPTPAPMDTPTPAPMDTPTPAPMPTPTPYPAATPTPTPTPRSTATPTATSLPPTPTPTYTPPPPPPGVTIEFWAAPPYVNAGQCTTLQWKVEGVREIYLDGGGVQGQGNRQVCPCQTTTYTLHVIKQDGSPEDHQVTVTVSGSCETQPPPPPPPPPQDTTGPNIGGVGLAWEDCQFYGQANISDPSGVNQAKFWYNINGQGWYSVWMQDIGGGLWRTEIPISASTGIGTPAGTIKYSVWANDSLNNESSSSEGSEDFMCGGVEM